MISVEAFFAPANASLTTSPDRPDIGAARFVVLASHSIGQRETAARAAARAWAQGRPHAVVVPAPASSVWPFRELRPSLPDGPAIVWAPDLHEAFINRQTASTRLVTTQPPYVAALWTDHVGQRDDVLLLATADTASLLEHAPEIASRQGPFASAFVDLLGARDEDAEPAAGRPHPTLDTEAPSAQEQELAAAFRATDAGERLALCVKALETSRTAPALVAAASVCMEVNDIEAAGRDLEEALALAPTWAAAHFEYGKLWLRRDDMARASEAFGAAAAHLPTFVSAWANLGATLGELDRPDEALAAFERARDLDPANDQTLNNIGVVTRELGRLAESEAAFREVIARVPDLAFGYYNLGHTLFLQGRYRAALGAYTSGQRRDPERNPVQASRVALCLLATGESTAAMKELREAASRVPPEYRQQLLSDTTAVLWALLTDRPDLPGWAEMNAWLQRELARSST